MDPSNASPRVAAAKGPTWKPHTRVSPPPRDTAADDDGDAWDISRINRHWEIDHELRRSLPFLARAKRSERETAADKFLRLSKLPLPAAPLSETMFLDMAATPTRQGTQRALAMTAEVKAKYFGPGAKSEGYAIFRKLAQQKYLTTTPLDEFLGERQQREDEQREVLGTRSTTPAVSSAQDTQQQRTIQENSTSRSAAVAPLELVPTQLDRDRKGLFSRQFTARHKFSALCLEKDLPPCLRLIIRNYFSPEINVSHMAIGDELASVFAACLIDLPMVTGLNVRNNRLGDHGLQAIIDVVVAKKDLYHLDLSENKVDGDASAALAEYLASPTCALQSLRLSHADVDDGELAPFAKALHTNRSLRILDMSRNLLGNTENLNVVQPSIVTGGEALATMLSINYSLTSLDLSWNYLRLGGAVELGRALAYNNGLRELNLAYNAFGNTGAQAVGEALLSNSTLEKLNLSNNNIPAHGAQAIACALKLNQCIVQLNLDGNPLGQPGGRALLHAVAACTDRQLNVSMEGCNFDLSDADAFDPSETTGTYDLNMSIPYERAIALELLRVANTKQGCKFLSITHVSSTTKQKRNIKVELREVDGSDAARRRLLKTAGILTDTHADEEELKQYQLDKDSLVSLFHELDEDDSGFVDEEELKDGMRKLGLVFRDEDVPRYIAQYDLDGTGTIELDEFIELMSGFNLEADHFSRHVYDIERNEPLEIPTEGQLIIDFVDFHVSADHDNAHSQAGVERLIENIGNSKNKSQMLEMAKSGLYFRAQEAQMLLDNVSDVYEITQAVTILLPNMVDPKSAYMLIDHNLNTNQRVRVQHLMGPALQPMLGLATGHYKIDLGNDLDRLTLRKIIENSTRTAFLRKKQGLKDTSQHSNFHGFRNETFNGKVTILEPQFLDTMPKFGMLEFDYVQIGRQPQHPMSEKRFEQFLRNLQIEQMTPHMGSRADVTAIPSGTQQGVRRTSLVGGSPERLTPGGRMTPASRGAVVKSVPTKPSQFPPTVPNTQKLFAEVERIKTIKNYLKFGDGHNDVVEIKPKKPGEADPETEDFRDVDLEEENGDAEVLGPRKRQGEDSRDDVVVITRNGKETCTGRRLLLNLQWLLATRWITARQAVRLVSVWPTALAASRVDAVCVIFDRLADLHNFNGILSALSEVEAAQCIHRLGWLNIWTPLMPDNYYELHLALYEEREVAKALVRLAIDEPGENWQRETFGWTREELIPGWELNLSWLKDGGFPEKGYLCLEYYSGADKGCGPVWPTRRELASSTLCGLPDDAEEIVQYIDSLSMRRRS